MISTVITTVLYSYLQLPLLASSFRESQRVASLLIFYHKPLRVGVCCHGIM